MAVPAPENAPATVPMSRSNQLPTPSATAAIAKIARTDTTTGCHPDRSELTNDGPAAMPTM